ncbi:MAG TPA: extensin family protein [Polyangiaceae bacterium]|nr:extensin family protein [Polyangiaceae bacterium]
MPLFRLYLPQKSRFGAGLRRFAAGLAAGGVALSLGVIEPAPAEAASPFLVVPEPGVAELTPAYRYANMTDDEALAELDKRQILYSRVGPVPGVRAPIRLTGRLHGVYFHSSLPPEQRVTSIFEILDARLALALDDFAAVLAQHDIDEVVHYTMYRPNVARPGQDDHADHADQGGKRARSRGADADKAAEKKTEAPKLAALESESANANAKKPAGAKQKQTQSQSQGQKSAPKAPAPESKPAEPTGKAILSKSSLSGAKGSLDSSSKKSSQKAPSTAKQKSAAALPPKSPAPLASPASPTSPTSSSAQPKASKPASTLPKAGISLPKSPVAAVKSPGQTPRARTSWAPPGTRHPAGLAIDVGLLRKRDGRWLSVAGHFHGKIGDKTCGPGVSLPEAEDARELRAIVCESEGLGIFTYVLTPNYNAAHADHYHMEIKPGVRWFLYH